MNRVALSVGLLAGATLLLESALTRFLAVAQYYHFAFLVVSLALLGFGTSGSFLSLRPGWGAFRRPGITAIAGMGFAAGVAVAYGVANWLPFDSYSIAWERRQVVFFVLYYLALASPFFFAGLGIGAALAGGGGSHRIYAANLLGSGIGALLALFVLALAGAPGAVLAAALLGLLAAWVGGVNSRLAHRILLVLLLGGLAGIGWQAARNLAGSAPLGLVMSPYKGLASALRYPGSQTVFSRWNAFARADLVTGAGTRTLPGLSYAYTGDVPPQLGLSFDGESVQPVTLVDPTDFSAAAYLPEALVFALRPQAATLVLEPGAGLGVLQTLAGTEAACAGVDMATSTDSDGAPCRVTAVVSNPLALEATQRAGPGATVYTHPRVRTVLTSGRSYLTGSRTKHDVIFQPLTDSYRPVSSGAYGLGETYGLTVQAVEDALAHLAPKGLLVVTRWLQVPPSEDLRLAATVVEALERHDVDDPGAAIVAYRGIQTISIVVQPDGWTTEELAAVRSFLSSRRYDLVWAPDVQPEETNRFNRLPTSIYYEAVRNLLGADDRTAFYATYPYAIAPSTDDRPFFYHFFKWQQTPQVLANLGRSWQPFGGSGYLVLLALLGLVLLLSATLIVAPLVYGKTAGRGSGRVRRRAFAYFGLLGLAFLFVEIPLIQRAILLVEQPTYAFTAVVSGLLVFSGLGSVLSQAGRLPHRSALVALVVAAVVTPFGIAQLANVALGWPLQTRALALVLGLGPLGFLMGLPFPLGLRWLAREAEGLIGWAWAINGSASVAASVLAALLALSDGFMAVLLAGAFAYAGAVVAIWPVLSARPGQWNE